MEEQYLRDLGFTEGEEKVYLALLKLGSSTSGPIAKEAGVSRSKLYEILERLAKKGVVGHYKKNNVSYFRAAPPRRILDHLKQRQENLRLKQDAFAKKLPLFEELIGQKEIAREAEVFEGMEGIKNIREEALGRMESGDVMYYIGPPSSGYKNVTAYWDDWNRRRIKKKITAKIIFNQDAEYFGKRRAKQAYTDVKYLNKTGNSHAWIEIYGDIIAIAMKEKTPMSIVIRNPLVAQSFKTYFDCLWVVALDKIKG
jgi:sugar-specific transcriptional regulator TrmB